MQIEVVSVGDIRGVGVVWSGTFEQAAAGEIRDLIATFRQRFSEIPRVVQPDSIVGASYHDRPDGFTIYIAAEVSQFGNLPIGMTTLTIPAAKYIRYQSEQGRNPEQSYLALYQWMESKGYERDTRDGLPEQLEYYPMTQDLSDTAPAFTAMIPVK